MSFRKVQRGYKKINRSMDSIESRLKDIEITVLREKTAELERKLERAVKSQPVPSFRPFQAPKLPNYSAALAGTSPKLPPALSQLAKPLKPFDALAEELSKPFKAFDVLAEELSKPFKAFDVLAEELSKPFKTSPGGSA